MPGILDCCVMFEASCESPVPCNSHLKYGISLISTDCAEGVSREVVLGATVCVLSKAGRLDDQ